MEEKIVNKLLLNEETIASMESCTSGSFASTITNVSGASGVLRVSLVTYSNEFKIKFGVSEETINKYTVYSGEVAREMAYNVSKFASSTYGVGVTGQIGRSDPENPYGKVNEIFACFYNSKTDNYTDIVIECPSLEREDCKKFIVQEIMEKIIEELGE